MCHQCSALFVVVFLFSGCLNYSGNIFKSNQLSQLYISESADVKIELEEIRLNPAENTKKITVYKIKLDNRTSGKLLIRYKHFKVLAQKTGYRYCALPPYEIFGSSQRPSVVLSYPFPVSHQIECSRFFVASFCSRMYQELPVSEHLFTTDSGFYSRYYKKLALSGLSVPHVLERIIPEGELDTGGYVSGNLYFEKIKGRNLLFQMEVVEADQGKLIDIIQIRVKKK